MPAFLWHSYESSAEFASMNKLKEVRVYLMQRWHNMHMHNSKLLYSVPS